MVRASVLSLLALSVAVCAASTQHGMHVDSQPERFHNGDMLKLIVAFCPTDFTSKGAVVSVDARSGDYHIDAVFDWPKDTIFGCDLLYDPMFTYDPDTHTMYLEFNELFGLVMQVSLDTNRVERVVKPDDAFFVGFTNFQLTSDHARFVGTTGTATQSGPCQNGCFAYGEMRADTGEYHRHELVLFKAMMSETRLLDSATNKYYVQASYDLRDQRCAPKDSDLCLLRLDGATGKLESAIHTEFTIYNYGRAAKDGKVFAWLQGFPDLCQHPYQNFLFATVDLATATAEPHACVPSDVTVDMDEWVSSFSSDQSLFATGSGNAEEPRIQVLVLDTATAKPVLDARLEDLPQKLGCAEGLLDIWAVQLMS